MLIDYELNELKREFLSEAAEKVREIQSVLDEGRNGASLDRLAYLAHQLKGSGGSYGYQGISADAQQIEHAVEQLIEGSAPVGTEESIQQHLLNLRTEIDQRRRELGG